MCFNAWADDTISSSFIHQTYCENWIVESSSYSATMAAPEIHHLFHNPIADHSFSADRGTLAIARQNTVELYGRSGSAFKLKEELKGHDKTVTSVDIAPNSGRIVSCSQGLSTPSFLLRSLVHVVGHA